MNASASLTSPPSSTSLPEELAALPEEVGAERWRYVRFVDHGDQSAALAQVIRPWLRSLVDDRLMDRFFFIRYELGGPHLRLRWRLSATDPSEAAKADREITDRLETLALSWWREHPPGEPWDEEKVRRINRDILGREPETVDEDPRFDHGTWHRAPMTFETRRYGGPQHLARALDLFGFSSVIALELVSEHGAGSPSFVPRVIGRLIRLAFALARDPDELLSLVGYGRRFFGPTFDECQAQGDRFFAKAADGLGRLAAAELTAISRLLGPDGDTASGDESAPHLERGFAAAARAYAEALPSEVDRWYALVSHLHMLANRVGAWNPQEVYWSRLAELACLRVQEQDPETWRRLWEVPRSTAFPAPGDALTLWRRDHHG